MTCPRSSFEAPDQHMHTDIISSMPLQTQIKRATDQFEHASTHINRDLDILTCNSSLDSSATDYCTSPVSSIALHKELDGINTRSTSPSYNSSPSVVSSQRQCQSPPPATTSPSPTPSSRIYRGIHAFVAAATSSPLLMSALTAIDAAAAHPLAGEQATANRSGLQWTISSLLALYLRTNRTTISQEDLLAMLWTMESWADARRSIATTVLGDYLRHIAAFDNQLALSMTATWKQSFTQMKNDVVASQKAFLNDVQWSLRLSDEDIMSAHRILFAEDCPPADIPYHLVGGGRFLARAACARAEALVAAANAEASGSGSGGGRKKSFAGECAWKMNSLCAKIWMHSHDIQSMPSMATSSCRNTRGEKQQYMLSTGENNVQNENTNDQKMMHGIVGVHNDVMMNASKRQRMI